MKNLFPKLSYLQFMIIILIILFIGYSLGLIIVNTINKKLKDISINVPTQDVIVKVEEPFISKKIKKKTNNKIPEYDTLVDEENLKYINATDDIDNICCKNHEHVKCNHGTMNYGDPLRMSQIDRNAFKFSFNCNKCTLQDYINWLYMYLKDLDCYCLFCCQKILDTLFSF